MNDLASHPKVLTEEEIDAMLHGDRRGIDKMLLTQINGLSASFIDFKFTVFPEHARKEEEVNKAMGEVVSELGGKEVMRARIAYIDEAIRQQVEKTKFYADMRTDLAKHTLRGLLIVLGMLVLYWWNGHVPTKP